MMRSNGAPIGGLSHAQARFFQDQGYLRVLDVLSEAEIAKLKAFVIAEKTKADTEWKMGESPPPTKLYGLYGRNPELLSTVLRHPRLLPVLWSLLGPNVVFVTNRHNHATVNDAAGTKRDSRLHRDVLQPTRGLVTAAVYLEEATPQNGCTHILPGSHTLPYVGVPQPDGGGTWMDEHEEYLGLEDQALPVPMPAGSILIFTGLAFHGVGANTSNATRISMTFGFRAVDEIDARPDGLRQIMVTGQRLYRGNDA